MRMSMVIGGKVPLVPVSVSVRGPKGAVSDTLRVIPAEVSPQGLSNVVAWTPVPLIAAWRGQPKFVPTTVILRVLPWNAFEGEKLVIAGGGSTLNIFAVVVPKAVVTVTGYSPKAAVDDAVKVA
jgi:hypothetical protein